MGQALYRKHRPKSLTEVVGQEHITETLMRALGSGRISHAYLFSGPRGVGKTSIARILAHEINSLPYDDDSTHMDIIEIDAASNNSVEDVRDLREKVFVAPTSAKYKVYIIDEVHMLSKAAFNALLKTLEEPPAHVIFILATTAASKLPDTIISRTQHYAFKPVEQPKVISHLRHIAQQEAVRIDDEALALLAAHGEGSFRDSISLLDQTRSIGSATDETTSISAVDVEQLLGIAPEEAIRSIIATVGKGKSASDLLAQTADLFGHGLRAEAIASQLAEKLRTSLAVQKPLLPPDRLLPLLKQLIEVPASRNPERLLEIILLEAASREDDADFVAPPQTVKAAEPGRARPAATNTPPPASKADTPKEAAAEPPRAAEVAEAEAPAAETMPVASKKPAKPKPPATEHTTAGPTKSGMVLDETVWPRVLDSIKKEYNTLYGVLRMAHPVFGPDEVELQLKFSFHQKRLSEVKNKKIIADFIKRITGSDVIVSCTYRKDVIPGASAASPHKASKEPTPAYETMEAISTIFGGGEILK